MCGFDPKRPKNSEPQKDPNWAALAYRIVSYSAMPAPAAALFWRKMNIVMRVATKVPPPVMKTVMRMIRRMRKREIRHLDQSETTKKKQTASIK